MKKQIKLFIVALAVIILLAAEAKPVYASNFKQSTLDGVVYIVTTIPNYTEENTIYYATGTGFFVGIENEDPQYILTNRQVIEDFLLSGGGAGEGLLEIAYDKDTYEEAYVVTYNQEKDVAVLKLAKPTKSRSALKLKTVKETAIGSFVYAIGYPYTSDGTIEAVNYYGKNDATVTTGAISRLILQSRTGTQLLQMDVSINQGNSGGPLVDLEGYVVGINTYESLLDDDMNYAVSIEEAIPLLRNNNIPYELAKVNSFNQYLIPILGAAAALLVIIIVLVLVLNRGKNKKAAQAVPVEVIPMAAPIQEKKLFPVIQSMSGQNRGLSSAVTSQPIIIGRDSSICRIVFKNDTPGVSSKHCQIYFDESSRSFILTDLKSTYGTFLSNGQKLTPSMPYPLRAKDSFYLGEKDNLLYVDLE